MKRLFSLRAAPARFLVYLVTLVSSLFALHQSLNKLSDDGHLPLYAAARFEEMGRLGMEATRLFVQAQHYALGVDSDSIADVRRSLDLFWSRVEAANSYDTRRNVGDLWNMDLHRELLAALPEFDKAVEALRPGAPSSFAAMQALQLRFEERIIDFAEEAWTRRKRRISAIVDHNIDNIAEVRRVQTGFAGIVAIAALLLTLEGVILRRANRQLNQQVDEKGELLRRDFLTGIGNRLALEEGLAAREAQGHTQFAVVGVDLDGFKRVNDTLGHAAGDAVLKSVARVLARASGLQDLPCRCGGDEFLVLVEGSRARAESYAARVRQEIAALVPGGQEDLMISASVGLCHFSDLDGDSGVAMMVRHADRALYAAKRASKSAAPAPGVAA